MSRYLNEIRLGAEKETFREIINDVRQTYNIRSSKRPVPHITLFGPYNTDQGQKAKRRKQRVLREYAVVPFRVRDFDSFSENGVVYATVEPSKTLRELRRDLVDALLPVTYNQRPWDTDDVYDFHITIETNLGARTSDVLNYVRRSYNIDMTLYATRITALDKRRMMWEWDVPRGVELGPDDATTAHSWQQTMAALNSLTEVADNENSTPRSTKKHPNRPPQTATRTDDGSTGSVLRRLWQRLTK